MCEFVSWIEKGKSILFLTDDLIFNTEKGKLLQKQANRDDLKGHGAIRFYFGVESGEGEDKECTNFSNSANFPNPIIKAIKTGQMFGMAGEPPLGLLTPVARADYEAKRAPLDADYEAKRAALYADYKARLAPLDADYEARLAPLYADYKAKRDALFWDIFQDVRNRRETWR